MGAFLAYNLKLSVCFILFYTIYRLMLCRNTFYRTNRLVLLSIYALTLIIPFIRIQTAETTEIQQFISNSELFFIHSFYSPKDIIFEKMSFTWANAIVLLYIAGILFFLLRYVYFTMRIGVLIRNGEKIRLSNGATLVVNDKIRSPFTWMNYILVSQTDYRENNESLLKHETAHIEHRHSVDLLIAELFAVVQWYNPVIWFIKNELKDVHEYEADHTVLASGVNTKQYQLLLIKKAVGAQRFNSMTNSLNHSKLKKRITMMMKKKNSNWERLKYVIILPLAAFAVALFARPEISKQLDEISAVKVSDFTSFVGENLKNYADTVKVKKKEKQKPAKKLPDLPDDPQQINYSKEWKAFFETTSPEEFMEMVKQAKGKSSRLALDNLSLTLGNLDYLGVLNLDSLLLSLSNMDSLTMSPNLQLALSIQAEWMKKMKDLGQNELHTKRMQEKTKELSKRMEELQKRMEMQVTKRMEELQKREMEQQKRLEEQKKRIEE